MMIDILPLLKRGDSYRVQRSLAESPRRVPAADSLLQSSLHRLTGHVLPLRDAFYNRFILCAIHPRPEGQGFSRNSDKVFLIFFLSAALLFPGHILADDLADKYFTGSNPRLTAQERAAIDIARRWNANTATATQPVPGANGAISFLYGVNQPSIVCAVLQVCDVALQPGEQVNSINLGDTARWTVEPAITGSGSNEVQHLIIKPMDVGLETSLVVTTNRRVYHLRLRSHRNEYMPYVSFTYPEEALAKWDAIQRQQTQERNELIIPQTGEYLGDLSFNYSLSGYTRWKPLRVYNDGQKTIIEMPHSMEQTEAPTLLVVRRKGRLFRKDDTVMVNYRVQGNRYIVDTVFDRAILIAGVGRRQNRVTITRKN